jgi:hypothetical protein
MIKGVVVDHCILRPLIRRLGEPLYRMYLFPPGCRLVKGAEEMKWYKILSPDLTRVAYKANEEMAWARHDARRVYTALQRNGYDILGVDVWLPTKPGPTPCLRDWWKGDSQSDRIAKSAGEFIASFDWSTSDANFRFEEPFFNLVAKLQQ